MKLTLTYEEIERAIARNFGKTIKLTYVDASTVKASVPVKMLVFNTSASVKLSVEAITKGTVVMRYDGGFAIDKLIQGAILALRVKYEKIDNVLETKPGRHLWIMLWKLPQAAEMLKYIDPKSVVFNESGVEVSAAVK